MRPVILSCVFALLVSACGGLAIAGSVEPATFETRSTVVSVVDDEGDPVAPFTLALVDGTVHVGSSVELTLDGPIAGVVSADGHLDGPVVIDPDAVVGRVSFRSRLYVPYDPFTTWSQPLRSSLHHIVDDFPE